MPAVLSGRAWCARTPTACAGRFYSQAEVRCPDAGTSGCRQDSPATQLGRSVSLNACVSAEVPAWAGLGTAPQRPRCCRDVTLQAGWPSSQAARRASAERRAAHRQPGRCARDQPTAAHGVDALPAPAPCPVDQADGLCCARRPCACWRLRAAACSSPAGRASRARSLCTPWARCPASRAACASQGSGSMLSVAHARP